MLKKSLIAAGLIVTVALFTACGSSAPKQEETTAETTTQAETTVVQEETTTEAEKVITDKNASSKKTDTTEKETTTKKAETETTTKAPEPETTTKAAQDAQAATEAFAVAQYEDEGGAVEMEAFSAYYGVVAADGDGLTLREDPDSASGGLTLIPDGTEIAIEEVEDGWGLVNFDGMTGWVSLEFVE